MCIKIIDVEDGKKGRGQFVTTFFENERTRPSVLFHVLTDSVISSNVAEKDSTSCGGKSETNPTVSRNRTVIPDGSFPG